MPRGSLMHASQSTDSNASSAADGEPLRFGDYITITTTEATGHMCALRDIDASISVGLLPPLAFSEPLAVSHVADISDKATYHTTDIPVLVQSPTSSQSHATDPPWDNVPVDFADCLFEVCFVNQVSEGGVDQRSSHQRQRNDMQTHAEVPQLKRKSSTAQRSSKFAW